MSREEDLENSYYTSMMKGPVGRFGRYLMERSFDPAMDGALGVLAGESRKVELQARLASLNAEQRDAVTVLVRDALIAALHGLLHGLSHDEQQIQLRFDGQDVAADSDGLHGDLFWWLRDLSRHPYDALA